MLKNKVWNSYGKMPFEHWIFEDFIHPETVADINASWPDDFYEQETKNSKKLSTQQGMPKAAKKLAKFMNSAETCQWLSELTGIKSLLPDQNLYGAGLHCIQPGGYLNMHVDFNLLRGTLYRRLNLLIYLNQSWNRHWGGELILGDNEVVIPPVAGRCVIFKTSEDSWHGHPEPLRCPENIQRRSIAFYYYTADAPDGFAGKHSTIYRGEK